MEGAELQTVEGYKQQIRWRHYCADVSYTEIIQRLTDGGISVGYVILDGDRQTIHDRIIKRGEDEECWCMNNIQTCLDAQCGDMRAEHINTVGRTPGEIADEIIKRFERL